MKIPQSPPDLKSLQERLSDSPDKWSSIVRASQEAIGNGKYLHWDKLRHLKPPEDLSTEEWWLATKLSRLGLLRKIPFFDANGRSFQFGLPDPCQEYLHDITQNASGQIEVAAQKVANSDTRDRYLQRSIMEEAITSSQLEGAATTRLVAKEMLRTGRIPRDNDERMILNNYVAMQGIRRMKDNPLTPDGILSLHRILTEDVIEPPSAAGRLRRPSESVNIVDQYNVLLHVPPPAEELDQRLQALCDFANGKTPGFFVHPVIRAILLHFKLAYDHPFVDGNGRCARGLFYWCMAKQGYWLCEFISISEIIRNSSGEYGRAYLYTETDDNDLTYFILYHLRVIRRAIRKLHEYVSEKMEVVKQVERLLKVSSGFNHRQLALLSHALRHPDTDYTIQSHKISHGVVYQTARTDLYDLEARGLLVRRKIGRTNVFRPVKNLEQTLRHIR